MKQEEIVQRRERVVRKTVIKEELGQGLQEAEAILNAYLKERVATLENEIRSIDTLQRENERLRAVANLLKEHEDYKLLSAYIISWDSSNWRNTFTIGNGIHFHFFSLDVLIHQNRFVFINFYGRFKVIPHRFFFWNNLHSPSAEHKSRTYKYRVSNLFGRCNTGFNASNRSALWLWNIQINQQFFKQISVLCSIDGFTVCTDKGYPMLFQRFG